MNRLWFWWNRKPVKVRSADYYNLSRFKVGARVNYVHAPGKTRTAYIAAIGADAGLGECTLDVFRDWGVLYATLSNCFFNPHTRDVGTWHWEN